MGVPTCTLVLIYDRWTRQGAVSSRDGVTKTVMIVQKIKLREFVPVAAGIR